MSSPEVIQELVDAVENAAVYVSEAQEELHKQQAVLAERIHEAREANISIRVLEEVAGVSRETIRQIGNR